MEAKFLDDDKPKTLGAGWGTPTRKGRRCSSEILTSVGVAGPNLFLTLKRIILNFDYMNRVNKTNWKYISF